MLSHVLAGFVGAIVVLGITAGFYGPAFNCIGMPHHVYFTTGGACFHENIFRAAR